MPHRRGDRLFPRRNGTRELVQAGDILEDSSESAGAALAANCPHRTGGIEAPERVARFEANLLSLLGILAARRTVDP